ncbi:hypothetical protein BDN70DRAFT_350763 [Pholiota conissans]|uniref:Uncharacterized protein n=1 Tax=Pholiota conissans TaxID=109636 RepID=A0A9P5ZAG6_9AGAR|nr:hypothetical protein BDN70DRAFT_350763 [Pholiota conissans]
MTLSRASSLPISTLYKLVMQSQPALKTQRTEREWVRLFDRVLHAGGTGSGGCGVFLARSRVVGKIGLIGLWRRSCSMCPRWIRIRSGRR